MAYAKLQEWKRRLKKKITTIAVFSLIATTSLTGQAATVIAATQGSSNQVAIETIDTSEEDTLEEDTSEDTASGDAIEETIVSGPQYEVGQEVNFGGTTKYIKEVYSTDNDPATCPMDDIIMVGALSNGVRYEAGTMCHLLYSYDYAGGSGRTCRIYVTDSNGNVIDIPFARSSVMTQQEKAAKDAADKEAADTAAITAVQNKINQIKSFTLGDTAVEALSDSNKYKYNQAKTAYDALDSELQARVDATRLTGFDDDQREAHVEYVNTCIDNMQEPTRYNNTTLVPRGAYNKAVTAYPDIQSRLHLARLEEYEQMYKDIRDAATATTQQPVQPMTSFGDANASATTEAPKQEVASVDNLGAYEVVDKNNGIPDGEGGYTKYWHELQGITGAELLAAHPYPDSWLRPDDYWTDTSGPDTTRWEHFEGNKGYYIEEGTVRVITYTAAPGSYNINCKAEYVNTKYEYFTKYTVPARTNPGSGSTVYTLRAGQTFHYTGKSQGDFMQIKRDSDKKVGWIDSKVVRFDYKTARTYYITKDCESARGIRKLRKGQVLTGSCTRTGALAFTDNKTLVQPSTAWILKSGTLTKSAGGGSAVCKVTKASKVSIKEENATHFKVKVTKGKKSYTGWIKKSSISFTKTYKNKKSVKTMYLAVNRQKADALMGDAVNVIKFRYDKYFWGDGMYETDSEHPTYTKSYAKARKIFLDTSGKVGTNVRVLIQYADGQTEWVPFDYLRTTKKQALNAINTSYEQCKKGWEYLNELRKREGLKPVQWSDDAYNKTLRQYTIVAQNGLHLGNHLGEYDYYAAISGCGIYSKELGEYYHELASGTSDIAFGVGNINGKGQYVNRLNTAKNIMTNKGVGVSAMADMLGGHPGKYDWHPDAHSKTLMDPNATYGCMVIIQKADGQCGAIFEIR